MRVRDDVKKSDNQTKRLKILSGTNTTHPDLGGWNPNAFHVHFVPLQSTCADSDCWLMCSPEEKITHVGNEFLLPFASLPAPPHHPPRPCPNSVLSLPSPPLAPKEKKKTTKHIWATWCNVIFFFWTVKLQLFLSQLIFVPRPHKAWGE